MKWNVRYVFNIHEAVSVSSEGFIRSTNKVQHIITFKQMVHSDAEHLPVTNPILMLFILNSDPIF